MSVIYEVGARMDRRMKLGDHHGPNRKFPSLAVSKIGSMGVPKVHGSTLEKFPVHPGSNFVIYDSIYAINL